MSKEIIEGLQQKIKEEKIRNAHLRLNERMERNGVGNKTIEELSEEERGSLLYGLRHDSMHQNAKVGLLISEFQVGRSTREDRKTIDYLFEDLESIHEQRRFLGDVKKGK